MTSPKYPRVKKRAIVKPESSETLSLMQRAATQHTFAQEAIAERDRLIALVHHRRLASQPRQAEVIGMTENQIQHVIAKQFEGNTP